MFLQKKLNPLIISLCITSTLIVPTLSVANPILAKTPNQTDPIATPDRRSPGGSREELAFPLRRKPGGSREELALPLRRKPGGSREDIALLVAKQMYANVASYTCDSSVLQLTGLIPENLIGVTASQTPTLYFWMPSVSQNTTIEFVVHNARQEVVYENQWQGQEKAGIMAVELPTTDKGAVIQADQEYHWYFSIICDQRHRERDVVIEGLLKRVTPPSTLSAALATATPLEQVKIYRDHQLWHEALHQLVQLQKAAPHDPQILAAWKALMLSVDLEELSTGELTLQPE